MALKKCKDNAEQTDTFVVELGLSVEDQVNKLLCKGLDLERLCYNGVMSFCHKELNRMRSSKEWQDAFKQPKNSERIKKLSNLCKAYHLTEFDLMKQATRVCKEMGRDDIGAHEAQCIGRYVWKAVQHFLFKKSGKPRFKSVRRGFNSISGTDNTEIRFDIEQLDLNAPQPKRRGMPKVEVRNGREFLLTDDKYKATKIKPTCHCLPKHPKDARPLLYWRGYYIPIRYQETPYYLATFSKDSDPNKPLTVDNFKKVKFCRIIRRSLNGKKRWFVQIYLEGKPPVLRPRASTANCMGIDPGPKKVAYFVEQKVEQELGADGNESSKVEYEADLVDIAPNVDTKAAEKRKIQKKMDRSKRAMNPDNYNVNGTVKKGAHQWKKSNRYLKLQIKYQELCRKEAATRKRDHGTLSNKFLAEAGTIQYEKNNFYAYQRSHFGSSVQHSGVGGFFDHLKRSAESANLRVIELDPYRLKLSQYDPETDEYIKKPLSQRWHKWGHTGVEVHRDIMSAFLACYADNEKGHDRALLLSKWPAVEALLRVSGYCRQQLCTIDTPSREDSRDQDLCQKQDQGAEKESDVNS